MFRIQVEMLEHFLLVYCAGCIFVPFSVVRCHWLMYKVEDPVYVSVYLVPYDGGD